jgi:ribonuclease HII
MQQKQTIAGVDEAGRGPLAGAVFAGAVILDPEKPIAGLADSKILTALQREKLFEEIQKNSLAWSFGRADAREIEKINILQATFLAMQRAVNSLKIIPELVLIDGNQRPKLDCEIRMIIGGDAIEPAISAASIVAKVLRDREMIEWDKKFPQYGFAKHKGYPTKEHFAAIQQFGPCEIHRKTFAGVLV